MRFDLTTLHLFLSAVDEGSIAAAAGVNAIAPSAISRRISELEHRLNTPLLYRRTKGVEPTAAGDALVRHARNLVRLMGQMEVEMSEFSDGVRGHVRIVANSSSIAQFLPEDLSTFKADFPDIRIALREETSERCVQDVREGLADIAIFSEATSSQDLEVFVYRQDRLFVIAPSDHPLAAKNTIQFFETLQFEHVGMQPGSSLLGQLIAQAAELEKTILFAIQVTSFDGVRRMVESGLGIAVLPDGVAPNPTEGGRLSVIPLSDPWATRTLYVGVREVSALPLVVRKFLTKLIGAV
ncbi:MAG: LysR substrate-binding domain-containing protein [Rhodospirillales bacterium]|nr:LysR substrate-binding domain-containing protein [Rhodospirillales bacterium]